MTLDEHLAHLLWLTSPPFFRAWREYAWHRAKELAAEDPELSSLPKMLSDSVKKNGWSDEPSKPSKKASR